MVLWNDLKIIDFVFILFSIRLIYLLIMFARFSIWFKLKLRISIGIYGCCIYSQSSLKYLGFFSSFLRCRNFGEIYISSNLLSLESYFHPLLIRHQDSNKCCGLLIMMILQNVSSIIEFLKKLNSHVLDSSFFNYIM